MPNPPVFFRPDPSPAEHTHNGHHRAIEPATIAAAVAPPAPAPLVAPAGITGYPGQRAAAPVPGQPPVLDYDLVRTLQREVSDRIGERLRGGAVSSTQQRAIAEEETRRLVREHVDNRIAAGEGASIAPGYEAALLQAVTAYLVGFGRLQPLIDDQSVENIMVIGHDKVRVEYADGRVDQSSFTAAGSDEELLELLRRLAAGGATERTLSSSKPMLHLRLPDGSRLVAGYIVTPRPVVVIRRHRIKRVTLDELAASGTLSPQLADFLKAAVAGHLNIMIAGLPSSGKTTLLRAIASEIPSDEWFSTMETVYELALDPERHPWVVPFEERQGHGEIGPNGRPEGEKTLTDLFPDMLRMNMQRVVVGEVRAGEIVSMFDAGDTTQGTLSTIHARHAHAVFDRLASLLMRYGAAQNAQNAYMQVANAVDLVVFQAMQRRQGQPARRYVSHVLEVNGLTENGMGVARSELFAPRQPGGIGLPTGVRPNAQILEALAYGGLDPQLLDGGSWERGR
ncbi:Flp pilus assembly CpaF family ATPase [Krasilnikovia cinnamomea]|uniref:Flp pilus assembly CpaF family ATPase n=1 Tax=Krasilnikovia cinnamomea TaxID=349313 RepID=A0A4Q7Z841_9ACTN|nr:ATPase, T2SS/T4P/T4SS family [Krasilnikovia cinnamomea]RZU46640.1 Flp pilus assembly CpaF family ATPase [Krasilnikovia cinnamomea]